MTLRRRLKNAYSAFRGDEEDDLAHSYNMIDTKNVREPWGVAVGSSYSHRPDRYYLRRTSETSIVSAIYNKIANDVAALRFEHIRLNDDQDYDSTIDSHLNYCMTVSSNQDQTPQQFFVDLVTSMLDEGVVAVVPIETDLNPKVTDGYDILSFRTGRIIEWFPDRVKVHLYDDRDGKFYDIDVPKKHTAIIENPFYQSMNTPNSSLQRLIRKLSLLDAIDEQSGAGKLDLIVQLPYAVKSETRKLAAEDRLKNIEVQLAGSKYGIAYIDATEKVTQLNRAVDNNLMGQIEYLTKQVYNQLCMSEAVFDGTASEQVMLNYQNSTISPIASAIIQEFKRKFLTKTARTQRQSIKFFTDPFKLVPVANLAEIADKLSRNEIMSSNEFRAKLGYKPSKDERADLLLNKNLNHKDEVMPSDGTLPNLQNEE